MINVCVLTLLKRLALSKSLSSDEMSYYLLYATTNKNIKRCDTMINDISNENMKLKTFRCKRCKNKFDAYKQHESKLCPDCFLIERDENE